MRCQFRSGKHSAISFPIVDLTWQQKLAAHWVCLVFAQPRSGSDFTFISIYLNGLLQPIFKKVVERSRWDLPDFKCVDIF
jgi:hypothetical protein